MKFINNILVLSILLFIISCTAWPGLIPPPPGKKKTTIYPIPLPATSTTPDIRIANSNLEASTAGQVLVGRSLQLKAIDKSNADISSTITWSSSNLPVATINATSGLVTGVSVGSTTITATHASLPAASINVSVTAAGTSIIAFDGKEFLEIITNKTKEEN